MLILFFLLLFLFAFGTRCVSNKVKNHPMMVIALLFIASTSQAQYLHSEVFVPSITEVYTDSSWKQAPNNEVYFTLEDNQIKLVGYTCTKHEAITLFTYSVSSYMYNVKNKYYYFQFENSELEEARVYVSGTYEVLDITYTDGSKIRYKQAYDVCQLWELIMDETVVNPSRTEVCTYLDAKEVEVLGFYHYSHTCRMGGKHYVK